MKKNIIKKLANASYTDNKLSDTKVDRISNNLKNKDLKLYVKNLKTIESKKTVTVTLPSDDSLREIRSQFIKIYPDKKLVFAIDPSLLSGIKVVDYDNEYELSLKSFLEGSLNSTND